MIWRKLQFTFCLSCSCKFTLYRLYRIKKKQHFILKFFKDNSSLLTIFTSRIQKNKHFMSTISSSNIYLYILQITNILVLNENQKDGVINCIFVLFSIRKDKILVLVLFIFIFLQNYIYHYHLNERKEKYLIEIQFN